MGVYYACLSSVNDETNYQNAMLITLPSGVDTARFQNAVYEALCAHPYLLSRVVLNANGEPEISMVRPKVLRALSHSAFVTFFTGMRSSFGSDAASSGC